MWQKGSSCFTGQGGGVTKHSNLLLVWNSVMSEVLHVGVSLNEISFNWLVIFFKAERNV